MAKQIKSSATTTADGWLPKAELNRRGWTESLITTLPGEHDKSIEMQYYAVARVEAAEKLPAFVKLQEKRKSELFAELSSAAKADIKAWLARNQILQERDELYDAIAMAMQLAEMPPEQARRLAEHAAKFVEATRPRKKGAS
jgi:uncharacterized protein YcbX